MRAGQEDRQAVLNARDILTSIGEVVFDWQAKGDHLRWSGNAFDVLQTDILSVFPTGKSYTAHVTPDTIGTRYRAIFGSGRTDDGDGVPYECIYCLAPNGFENERRIWVEESGRWFADSAGRAERLYGVIRLVNERQHREQRERFLCQFDDLTGLYNRNVFCDQLQQALDRRDEKGVSACYLVAHIDNLRSVNQAYGFEVADQVIREVAHRISRRLRDGDLVGRLSGTKFGLLINNCSEKDMEAAAERFLEGVREELINTDAGPAHVTLSVGGVHLDETVRDLRSAEICALDALDRARQHHRGTFRSFNAMPKAMDERQWMIKMADEVISALNERRIALAYQPIVDTATQSAQYHEVLMRVDDKSGDPIDAATFVDFAEKLGLAAMLDHRVLELSLDDLFCCPDARLSMNVSPGVATDKDWISYLRARVGSYPEVAARLIVEITEAAAIRDLDAAIAFVNALRSLGVRVAIDDFGAGYSSFGNLQKLAVDIVKIEGSFVREIAHSRQKRAFVRMFCELAAELEIEVVAKWVENAQIAEILSHMKVGYLQGFHFGSATSIVPWDCDGGRKSVS